MRNLRLDFDTTPFIVIWEVTQACALACRHCRAEAVDERDPLELTRDEGRDLVGQVAAMGTPIMIFSGGDPLQRDDLEDLVGCAKAAGLRAATIPAATPRLTRQRVASLKDAGVDQMALSLDGSTRQIHDAFRGVEGSFDRTMDGARWARELDVPLQINTCFSAFNFDDFSAIVERIESLGIVFWEVFFLVPTGRGAELGGLSAAQYEQMFARLHEVQQRAGYIVKVTEAPHFRRFVVQQAPGRAGQLLARPSGPGGSVGMSPHAVNAGKGFCFVSHQGEVFPSGFLPVSCGNVRERSLAEIYRNAPLMRSLRDPSRLQGRCGRCDFADLCGGSRSRAHALTGDPFAEDPCCAYDPPPATSTG
ncbi:MAG: radical SAM/SPASM domain-containing protein [Phycisphaeraceae bacterium]|nr:radical SAM/SPASM domain-containing protein [Phycisphaeraceae bacterium]